MNSLTPEDFRALGVQTEGYSGSDLSTVVRDAIMQPVRTLQSACFFKRITVVDEKTGEMIEKWQPCSPGDPEAVNMTLMDIGPGKLAVPPISRFDFDKALMSVKPSVSVDDIKQHINFTSEFGQEGN